MTRVWKMSELHAPTLKEDPVEAELASHRLLLRGGFIRKTAAGIYSFLPLGQRVLNKINGIIREEMDNCGSQEIMMPVLQPAEIWHESGRWDDYGPELMRIRDRHNRDFCLGPTHEELVTMLVRNELRSYKDLPKALYQIQVKFRDEIRPRFGLLRTREFIMKDSYSFHETYESLTEHYEAEARAYARICERMGLNFRPVEADSGQIGGKETIEFMALADSGEAEIVFCECGFASDTEAAQVNPNVIPCKATSCEKVETPNASSIEALAKFLNVPEASTVKAMAGIGYDKIPTVFFIPGDHELNELKALKAVSGFELMTDAQLEEFGLVKGFMGPVALPKGTRVIADVSLENVERWIVGANDPGYHLVGAKLHEDFEPDGFADLISAKEGDACPHCGKPLGFARGIEVGQVFKLGLKYSEAMNATFLNAEGEEKPFYMGCYGWGVTRSMAATIEQYNDENGMIWPITTAPFEVEILSMISGDDVVEPAALKLADELSRAGVEVLVDERNERAGVKFADADLIGIPLQIILGKRGVANGEVEYKIRETSERGTWPSDLAVNKIIEFIAKEKARFEARS